MVSVGHSEAFQGRWGPIISRLMPPGLWAPWAALGFAGLDLAKWVKAEAGQSCVPASPLPGLVPPEAKPSDSWARANCWETQSRGQARPQLASPHRLASRE